MRTIDELRGKHQGSDIWIIGSGATAGYVAPEFFAGKISIGINLVLRRFRTTYVIAKDGPDVIPEALATGIPLILSEFAYAQRHRGKNECGPVHTIFNTSNMARGASSMSLGRGQDASHMVNAGLCDAHCL